MATKIKQSVNSSESVYERFGTGARAEFIFVLSCFAKTGVFFTNDDVFKVYADMFILHGSDEDKLNDAYIKERNGQVRLLLKTGSTKRRYFDAKRMINDCLRKIGYKIEKKKVRSKPMEFRIPQEVFETDAFNSVRSVGRPKKQVA